MLKNIRNKPYIFFIAPGFLIFTLLVVYPMITTFYNSLTDWDGVNKKVFIGLGNFIFLFTDNIFSKTLFHALHNVFYLVVMAFIIQIPLSLYFALMIDKKIKLHNFYKTIIFMPQVI